MCDAELGVRSGAIPSSALSVSSRKDSNQVIDAMRLGYSQIWIARRDDISPWVQVEFPSGRFH